MRVYWLKTLKKPSIYPLGKTPSAPSVRGRKIGGLKDVEGEERVNAVNHIVGGVASGPVRE